MNALLKLYSPERRPVLLAGAAGLVAGVAVVDALTRPYLSLAFLYLFPIVIVGGLLGRAQIVAVAFTCAFLGEVFSGLPTDEMAVRFLFGAAGLSGTGLFVSEIVRNREAAMRHARTLEEQQARVRDAEAELQFLIDTSPAAIITLDGAGRVKLANEAAHGLLGFAPGSLGGQPIAAYVPALQSVAATHPSRVLRTSLQCRGRRTTGETFLAGVWFSTHAGSDGPQTAAILVDLSDDLRNREDLSFDHLLKNARILVGAVAHEIRNVCSAALVVHKNLSRIPELRESEDLEALGTLMRGLEAMMALQLQPPTPPAPTRIELTTVFDELEVLLDSAYGDSQVAIDWQLPDVLPLVWGERYGLIQVFLNLAKNSLRAMEGTATRRLRISCSARAGTFRVHVEDTGIGVASPEHLFRPFRSNAASTGLGLYFSRAMMRQFGGDLLYEPRRAGACFTIVLAVAAAAAGTGEGLKDAASHPTGPGADHA